jgi:hypothetical protein
LTIKRSLKGVGQLGEEAESFLTTNQWEEGAGKNSALLYKSKKKKKEEEKEQVFATSISGGGAVKNDFLM